MKSLTDLLNSFFSGVTRMHRARDLERNRFCIHTLPLSTELTELKQLYLLLFYLLVWHEPLAMLLSSEPAQRVCRTTDTLVCVCLPSTHDSQTCWSIISAQIPLSVWILIAMQAQSPHSEGWSFSLFYPFFFTLSILFMLSCFCTNMLDNLLNVKQASDMPAVQKSRHRIDPDAIPSPVSLLCACSVLCCFLSCPHAPPAHRFLFFLFF